MLTVTQRAWREVVLQGKGRWLHVFVSGGGCNGFRYGMAWMDQPVMMTNDTWVVQQRAQNNEAVVVFKQSQRFLKNATLDHDPFKGFFFENPQAVSHCGCGQSVGFLP